LASGAAAELRRSVGTTTQWGTFGVTVLGIFLTPVFFYFIRGLVGAARKPAAVASGGHAVSVGGASGT